MRCSVSLPEVLGFLTLFPDRNFIVLEIKLDPEAMQITVAAETNCFSKNICCYQGKVVTSSNTYALGTLHEIVPRKPTSSRSNFARSFKSY